MRYDNLRAFRTFWTYLQHAMICVAVVVAVILPRKKNHLEETGYSI